MRAFGQLQAASIDGRLHNVFHRQTELEKLCKALIDQAAEIQDAISQDYGHRQAEAKVEFALAIAALKRNYATLQPDRAHQEEYLVASGKDAPSKRAPYGIVYIEPCNHSLFYSIVVPLSAALAAGNCVILLVSLLNRREAAEEIDINVVYSSRTICEQYHLSFVEFCKSRSTVRSSLLRPRL